VIRQLLTRVGIGLAAAAVIAVSAGVFVIALAFALFALVRPALGPAGAAAVVAGSAALLALIVGLALMIVARPKKVKKLAPRGADPTARVINLFKDAPVTIIAATAAAAFMALRNPSYLGAAIRSFLEGREPPPPTGKKRR
jgi:hypothetical protein